MTAPATPERRGPQPGDAVRPDRLRSSRRNDLETLGFLVGLLGAILVVVLTIGSSSPFGP